MKKIALFFVFIFCGYIEAYGVLKIDINQGNVEPMPIAIGEFAADNKKMQKIAKEMLEVIANNLQNSGFFDIIDSKAFIEDLTMDKQLNYSNWRKLNAMAVVAGSISNIENNKIYVKFKIWDPYRDSLVDAVGYQVEEKSWRRLAHKISDRIYKKMIGADGYFDTRVLFVAHIKKGKKINKALAIMDQDGANLKLLTNGKYLVSTPRFDHKSQRAIYMSYENKIPKVYVLDIETGRQKQLGNFVGMSFAPRFSPDGDYAVMSIADKGSTNIFEINLMNGRMKKLTYDIGAINTSPCYSSDGTKIVFNSDRAGSRQIYKMNRDGSDIERISAGSGIYATPVWSPQGDLIAFTKIANRKFYIGVMKSDGSNERLLTVSWLDEGPSWSPNGRVIMFTRETQDNTSNLYSVDVTGYNERLIATGNHHASHPSWSPILQ